MFSIEEAVVTPPGGRIRICGRQAPEVLRTDCMKPADLVASAEVSVSTGRPTAPRCSPTDPEPGEKFTPVFRRRLHTNPRMN